MIFLQAENKDTFRKSKSECFTFKIFVGSFSLGFSSTMFSDFGTGGSRICSAKMTPFKFCIIVTNGPVCSLNFAKDDLVSSEGPVVSSSFTSPKQFQHLKKLR